MSRKIPRTPPRIAPCSSSELTARPNRIAGNARIGSTNSVAVDRTDGGERGAPVGPSNPERLSIWNIVAPPVARRRGAARLTALPVSCAHATSNHLSVCNAMRISAQMQKNAAASSTKIGTNQAGNTPSSWGSDPNITIRPGSTR